jgi:hypothetical protein
MSLLIQIGLGCLLFVVAFTLWAAAQSSVHGGQTMKDSVIEAWTNIGIGFGINYFANLIVLPLDGYHISLGSAFWVGAIFTAISVVRQIILRRIFNWRMIRKQARAA